MVHEKIAIALEEIHQEDNDSASSQIAYHYDHAGRVDKAIQYYKQAAKVAQQVYALEEALRLLRRGIGILQSLPVNKNREQNELEMRLTLGPMLASLNGYHAPDVQENNNHIRKLSSRLDQEVHTPVLRSMAISSVVQGDLDEVYKLGKQILKGPEKEKKSVIESEGNYVAGVSSFWQGKFDLARNHFNDAIDSYDPRNEQIHIDYYAQQPKIVCQIRLALTYLYLGFPEQAGQWFRSALDDARKCNHPFSLAYALYYGAVIKSELGEVDTAAKLADECVTLTDKRGYNLWYLIAFVFQSRIHFQKDGDLNKIEEFQSRLDQMRSAGIRLKSPFYASHLARTRLITGNTEAALEAADYALDLVNERGESWYLAEIYRTRGNILYIIGGNPAETEKWLQKANSVAGKQNARLFQLRAVRDLAKLWHDQNKTLKALQELQKIYGQFTEGLETPDLKDAAGLIEKLS
jgi:tetratricopeptide (TPR) repeat protein